jgi:stearoyl-CoA desaturase (delta-9 desaturase)
MSYNGLIDLPWWGYVLVTLGLTHVTIAGVTIFLHRHQAHRALDLHPIPSHFFRFWLWLTTGMVTREWAAIHRKHHAKCETADDPHSPQVKGFKKVMWEGAELYRAASKDRESIEKYGHGTPDDWLERKIYCGQSQWGIVLMLAIDLLLFGPIGLTIWAVQMFWIPFFAAGIINGVGHYWGYRNFQSDDASTNVFPWGILIGGEELHNNHHSYGTSARLSSKWYEFDIGWMYIRILEMLGLAKVKKLAPKVNWRESIGSCDLAMLQAVITHRYDVLARYGRSLRTTYQEEFGKLRDHGLSTSDRSVVDRLVIGDARVADEDRARVESVLKHSKVLETIYAMRVELSQLWQRSTASKEQLVRQLDDWCHRAETSGIAALGDFSRQLRRYA